MAVKRFSVSMEGELVERFDRFLEERGYENRSEAIRELIEDAIIRRDYENPEMESIGTLAIVFDHGKHLDHRLQSARQKYLDEIVASMHVQIGEERSLEIIVIRSTAGRIQEISNHLVGIRGVLYGELLLNAPENTAF